jgi:pimeloyl-ACP methyl ester carboxylesterase
MPGFVGGADSWLRRLAGNAIAIAAIAVVIGSVPVQRAWTAPAVTAENLTFVNAGVTLRGTLYRAHRPFAAVVIVHGSGQEKRMSEFAALLAGQGVTTLTYDKRGVGESGGVYAGPEVGTNNVDAANLRLLAGDAAAAAAALSERLAHDRRPVGLLGFSQAGWIIPIAAGASPSVRFMVLFSGPVVTAREQLRFQFLTEGKPEFWATHTEDEVRERLRTDPDRYQFDDTDPRDSLAGLSIPGLWIFGGQDVQLPVQLSIERLESIAPSGAKLEYRVFPALDHNTAFAVSSEPVTVALQWMASVAGGSTR